ncbi:uncharacterized protein CG4951 isoform X2 [Drosophila kikkawai]|uniref:Uncharacterized protein CG4951 isoform X2 n=1 Tax=Drosophila kikkawai TaxID=30033 RepID=A0A6P4IWS3_DROKI|nr:uncharacterized protein CG4951 isoform X2 [Drosophila kikkawai]
MSFSATGDCQLLSQIYTYKGHRVACSVKVLPTPVTLFEREATNDYHWMTAFRWARIETALWRLFENLAQWQDAKKLRGELLIDHISVRYEATEKPHPASRSLLAGAELGPEDLSLDMQLQYMTVEDTAIVGMHTSKRKVATEAEINGTTKNSSSSRSKPAGAGVKPKAGLPEKPSQSKQPKHIDADDEDDDDNYCPPLTKIKRGRRSTSQGSHSQNGSSSRQRKRRSISTSERNSAASSVESKTARRSGRSPICPSRFNNFVLSTQQKKPTSGDGKTKKKPSPVRKPKEKPATSSSAKAPKEKSLTPTPAEALKVEQIDGARLDALQRLDSMLAISKPPEVQILLLENMGEADVLATFERYRSDFDKLFKERKNKAQTHSYVNVSHMDVMDILNADIRNKMMKQLAASYSTKSNHTSLIINGLLPLWIVLLFTDTYKLSHDEAVRQIKDQLRWNSYLKAMNNDPLSSDLDG